MLKVTVNANRAKAGKKALSKTAPSVNMHGANDQCAECDMDEEQEPTVEAIVKEREASMAALEAFMLEHEVSIPKPNA